MEDDKEKQIEKLKKRLHRISGNSVISFSYIITAIIGFLVLIQCESIWGAIILAVVIGGTMFLTVYRFILQRRIDILHGYYIYDGVKYYVDSKGKVVRKVQGEIIFKE